MDAEELKARYGAKIDPRYYSSVDYRQGAPGPAATAGQHTTTRLGQVAGVSFYHDPQMEPGRFLTMRKGHPHVKSGILYVSTDALENMYRSPPPQRTHAEYVADRTPRWPSAVVGGSTSMKDYVALLDGIRAEIVRHHARYKDGERALHRGLSAASAEE
jgi:hypothetical protein